MKALITGIAGFAGSHLAEHLLASGDEVLGCTRDGVWPDGMPDRLIKDIPLVAWNAASRFSQDALSTIREFAPECIYHLAAISVPSECDECGSHEPTALAVAVNVESVGGLVELARSLVSEPRVLLVSSCHAYAPVSDETPIDESWPRKPNTAYGLTKLQAERALLRAIEEDGVDGLIARPFHHTGPRQRPQMMVPQWSRQLSESSDSIDVYCRDAFLDLGDVRDVVRAYRLLVKHGQCGEAYNVGTGRCVRSGDVLDTLCRLHGGQPKVCEASPGRRQEPIADTDRIASQAGWGPSIPLEQTLRDTLSYWLERSASRERMSSSS